MEGGRNSEVNYTHKLYVNGDPEESVQIVQGVRLKSVVKALDTHGTKVIEGDIGIICDYCPQKDKFMIRFNRGIEYLSKEEFEVIKYITHVYVYDSWLLLKEEGIYTQCKDILSRKISKSTKENVILAALDTFHEDHDRQTLTLLCKEKMFPLLNMLKINIYGENHGQNYEDSPKEEEDDATAVMLPLMMGCEGFPSNSVVASESIGRHDGAPTFNSLQLTNLLLKPVGDRLDTRTLGRYGQSARQWLISDPRGATTDWSILEARVYGEMDTLDLQLIYREVIRPIVTKFNSQSLTKTDIRDIALAQFKNIYDWCITERTQLRRKYDRMSTLYGHYSEEIGDIKQMLINVYENDDDSVSTEDLGTIESILASSNIKDSLEREKEKLARSLEKIEKECELLKRFSSRSFTRDPQINYEEFEQSCHSQSWYEYADSDPNKLGLIWQRFLRMFIDVILCFLRAVSYEIKEKEAILLKKSHKSREDVLEAKRIKQQLVDLKQFRVVLCEQYTTYQNILAKTFPEVPNDEMTPDFLEGNDDDVFGRVINLYQSVVLQGKGGLLTFLNKLCVYAPQEFSYETRNFYEQNVDVDAKKANLAVTTSLKIFLMSLMDTVNAAYLNFNNNNNALYSLLCGWAHAIGMNDISSYIMIRNQQFWDGKLEKGKAVSIQGPINKTENHVWQVSLEGVMKSVRYVKLADIGGNGSIEHCIEDQIQGKPVTLYFIRLEYDPHYLVIVRRKQIAKPVLIPNISVAEDGSIMMSVSSHSKQRIHCGNYCDICKIHSEIPVPIRGTRYERRSFGHRSDLCEDHYNSLPPAEQTLYTSIELNVKQEPISDWVSADHTTIEIMSDIIYPMKWFDLNYFEFLGEFYQSSERASVQNVNIDSLVILAKGAKEINGLKPGIVTVVVTKDLNGNITVRELNTESVYSVNLSENELLIVIPFTPKIEIDQLDVYIEDQCMIEEIIF